jgi:hypothetical protein
MTISRMNRRSLFKVSALAAGGLMLELTLPSSVLGEESGALVSSRELNVYIQIAADGQITIYSRKADQALGASETLMGGTRFGRVQASDLGAQEEIIFATVTNVNIIDVKGTGGAFGHGYFRDNPAVSSDLILLLRDEALPGSTSRPLDHKFLNFWELSNDYPRVTH